MEQFEPHLEMVKAIYNKYFSSYRWLRDDLIQEGNIALFKACQKFDASKGVKFATFAYKCIKNDMLLFLMQETKYSKYSSSAAIDKFENAVICDDICYVELKDSISRINDDMTKKVLYLALNGCNICDMSKVLNKKYVTIYKKIREIRQNLAEKLI